LEGDAGYQATLKVLDQLELNDVTFSMHTSMPVEEQFWQQFDGFYQLTEQSMRKELPFFITDPNNLAKVQALIEESDMRDDRTTSQIHDQQTRHIA